MAEVVIPVGYGNAVIVWNNSARADPITTTLGYSTAGSGIDAIANANAIQAAAVSISGSPSMAAPASMTTDFQLTSVHVYERRVAGPLIRGDSTGAATIGTITASANTMILSSTVRVSKRTGFVGRQFRGRMYAPFTRLEADVSTAGVILASPLTTIQATWSKFLANLLAFPINPVLLHTDGVTTPTPITSFFVQTVVGTQRRRLH